MSNFNIKTNELFITDINYKKNSWCNICLTNMKNGKYYLFETNNIFYVIKFGYKSKINEILWEESTHDYSISNGVVKLCNYSTNDEHLLYTNSKILNKHIGKTYGVLISEDKNNEIIGIKIILDY